MVAMANAAIARVLKHVILRVNVLRCAPAIAPAKSAAMTGVAALAAIARVPMCVSEVNAFVRRIVLAKRVVTTDVAARAAVVPP